MRGFIVNTVQSSSPLEFEVYLLVTMQHGMINRQAVLESKLSERGLSFMDAQKIHQRLADLFAHSGSQFEDLKRLVGATGGGARSLTYNGVLWPEFAFTATADGVGALESARYMRENGRPVAALSPVEQPPWSMDTSDFNDHFGPTALTYRSSLFDSVLPAHEVHEFTWEGTKYGAGFSWGLFLFASKLWT